jgi:xanthine permease
MSLRTRAAKGTGRTTTGRPEDEKLPFGQLLVYGTQHILTMYGGVIAPPLIVGGAAGLSGTDLALLVTAGLFISGLATVLQTIGVGPFGARLPIVQGISFASVSTMVAIASEGGLRPVFGSIIVAGLIGLVLSSFFAKLVRFFPPVVTGTIITVIGLSLMPVAAGWITGQPEIGGEANPDFADPGQIGLALLTLAIVLVMTRVPALSRLAILLGLLLGTTVAWLVGKTDFGGVGDASVLSLPEPFAFGAPTFEISAIVSMTIVILVTMVETTADLLAVGRIVGTKVDARRVGDGLRADMTACALAPIVNSFPATAFAQNVGLVALTQIKSRFAVAVGGLILLVLGLSPLLAALVGVIPLPVLGGAGIVLFGIVAASGIRTLSEVEYRGNHNLVLVAASVGFGLLPVVSGEFWSEFPDWFATIFDSGISSASIMAVGLNLFFNMLPRPRGAHLVAQPHELDDAAGNH